jgi:hypothetical protein
MVGTLATTGWPAMSNLTLRRLRMALTTCEAFMAEDEAEAASARAAIERGDVQASYYGRLLEEADKRLRRQKNDHQEMTALLTAGLAKS